jgi:hypothetical protein
MANSAFDNLVAMLAPCVDLERFGTSGATDFSPNANHVALVNGASWGQENRFAWLAFDGVNDCAEFGSAFTIGATWSFEAWIYPASGSAPTYQTILADAAGALGIWYRGQDAPAINRGKINIFNGGLNFHNTTALTANAWNHIAVRCSSGVGTFYLNGVADGTFSGWTSQTRSWKIGADTTVTIRPFAGRVASLAVWDRQITTGELATMATRPGALQFLEKRPRLVSWSTDVLPSDRQVGDLLQCVAVNDTATPALLSGWTSIQTGGTGPFYNIQERIWSGGPAILSMEPGTRYFFWNVRGAQIGGVTTYRKQQTSVSFAAGANSWAAMNLAVAGGDQLLHVRAHFCAVGSTLGSTANASGMELRNNEATFKLWELAPMLKADGATWAGEMTAGAGGSGTGWFITFGYWEANNVAAFSQRAEVVGDTTTVGVPRVTAVQELAEVAGRTGAFVPVNVIARAEVAEVLGTIPFVALASAHGMSVEVFGDTTTGALPRLAAFASVAEVVGDTTTAGVPVLAAVGGAVEVIGAATGLLRRLHAFGATVEAVGVSAAGMLAKLTAVQELAEVAGRTGAFLPARVIAAGAGFLEVAGRIEAWTPARLIARASVVEALGDATPGGVPLTRAQSIAVEVIGTQRQPAQRRAHEELFFLPWDSVIWQTV